jgi:peptidyl-prolyl cis-trans isomerase B (cyclophilin B)
VSPSTTQKRRAAARARYQAYLERRSRKEHRRAVVRRTVLVVVGVVAVGLAGWWLVSALSDDEPAAADPTPTPSRTAAQPLQWQRPEQVLEPGVPATATIATSGGDIVVELAATEAPKASNSLAFLASEAFYDGTSCHRLVADPDTPLYVLQCGDRTGTGEAGPGYTVPDENLPKAGEGNYPAGTLAMAEPPGGDAGSQFFLVYRDSTLPPDYTVLGTVTSGLDVLRELAAVGIRGGGTDGVPAAPVVIDTLQVEQG